MLNDEYQRLVANDIIHAATMASEVWKQAAWEAMRPSTIYRPRLSVDGNQWCALYGDDLQNGVAGFGDSPNDAMYAFDAAWNKKIPRAVTAQGNDTGANND